MAALEDFDGFATHGCTRLSRVAYLLTGDYGLGEDLLQTALAKAWRAWARVQGDPEPYVRRILVTTAISWRARSWRGEVATATVPDVAEGETADLTDLRAALLSLPPRQRACIVLRFVEDLSERQTAEQLNISVGTVKSQTSRALVRLREHPRLSMEEMSP